MCAKQLRYTYFVLLGYSSKECESIKGFLTSSEYFYTIMVFDYEDVSVYNY